MNAGHPPIRIGYIEYVNTFPFFNGLEQELGAGRAEFVRGSPARINALMRRGEIDIGLVSSLEYALCRENYYVLSEGCIGSSGATKSVILCSKFPIERLNGKRIALSKESLSSASLLKILLSEKFGFKNPFVENLSLLPEMLKNADAGLVIGDQALFLKRDPAYFEYDLCELWRAWQGLPFCFAVWVVRRSFADRYPFETRSVAGALEANSAKNLSDPEGLFADLPKPNGCELDRSMVLDYWQRLTYRLDPELLKGLECFYELARRVGLLDREIVLEYANAAEVK